MNKFLKTLSVSGGFVISFAMPLFATSVVNVRELPPHALAGVKHSPVKPRKGTKAEVEMSGLSSKLFLENRRNNRASFRSSERSATDIDIPVIYGNIVDSYELSDLGLYQLPRSADDVFKPLILDIEGERGGVAMGGVYYVTTDEYDGGTVRGYSLETGEVVYEAEVPYEHVPIALCLNPADNKLYGIFYPENYGNDYLFANIDYSTETPEFTPIGLLPPGVYTALSCDAMGNMYVLRDMVNEYYEVYDSEFFKLDSTTGNISLIGNVGYFSEYATSGCIDPSTGRMFYAMCTWDKCALIEIDVNTGLGTELLDFPDLEEVVGMYCPMPEVNDKAPAKVENLHLSFTEGNLTGKVIFSAPVVLNDGSEANEEFLYYVTCGDQLKTGSVSPGAQTEVEFTLSDPGKYIFRVYLSNEAGDGAATFADAFIGEDIPEAPSDFNASYADGKMTLDWNYSGEGSNGGYIDMNKIRYSISQLYPEESLLVASLAANTFEVIMDAPEEKTIFSYSLTMTYGDKEVATVYSNGVVLGSLLPPYTQNFSSQESMDDFIVIDGNEDDDTWTYFGNCVRIASNKQHASDDWLILSGIKLEEGKTYSISCRTWCQAKAYPEKIEVMIGNAPTPEAMTTAILEPTVISNLQSSATVVDADFVPSSTDVYYIGFHAISEANSYFLYLTDIAVTKGTEGAAPSSPLDFKAIPDSLGNPSAEISFVVPSTLVNGEPMDGPDAIRIMCGEEEIKIFEHPAAGSSISFTHSLEACGDYTFTAIAVKDEIESQPAVQSIYCGPGMPGAVTGVTLSEIGNTGEVILRWNAIETNDLGNHVNPEMIKYNVFLIDNHTVTAVVASNYSGTELTLNPELDENQTFVRYAVYGVTDKGQGRGMESELIPIGEPYVDFVESFSDGQLSYVFGVTPINEGLLGIYGDNYFDGVASYDADNGFLLFYGQQTGQGIELSSGKISIADMAEPVLDLHLRNFGSEDINQFEVEIRAVGGEYIKKLSVTPPEVGNEEWNLVRIPLSELEATTIQFRLRGIIINYGSIGIDNIRVYDANTTSTANATDSLLRITTSKGMIHIEGGEGLEAQILSIDGMVRKVQLAGNLTIPVASGAYVISAANRSVKVMVP